MTRFYITASKTENTTTPIYNSLPLIPVDIVKGSVTRSITVKTFLYANKDGITLPLIFQTTNAPYEEVVIDFSIRQMASFSDSEKQYLNGEKETYEFTRFSYDKAHWVVSQNRVRFKRREKSSNFYIENIPAAVTGDKLEIDLSLSGVDASSYTLPVSSLVMDLNPYDPTPASILSLDAQTLGLSFGEFSFTVDKLAYVFCAVGFHHLPEPQMEMIRFAEVADELRYSQVQIKRSYTSDGFKGSIRFDGLEFDTKYSLYCFAMNLNRIFSIGWTRLDFRTERPHSLAEFGLEIEQDSVSENLRVEYLKRLSILMEISADRLIYKTTCTGEPLDESYVASKETSLLWFYLLPEIKGQKENLISPIRILRNTLKPRTDDIKKFIPKLSSRGVVNIKSLNGREPLLGFRPKVVEIGFTSVTLEMGFNLCGWIQFLPIFLENSRWFRATNNVLYFFENQKIRNEIEKEILFFPYGSSILQVNELLRDQEYLKHRHQIDYTDFNSRLTSVSENIIPTQTDPTKSMLCTHFTCRSLAKEPLTYRHAVLLGHHPQALLPKPVPNFAQTGRAKSVHISFVVALFQPV